MKVRLDVARPVRRGTVHGTREQVDKDGSPADGLDERDGRERVKARGAAPHARLRGVHLHQHVRVEVCARARSVATGPRRNESMRTFQWQSGCARMNCGERRGIQCYGS